MVLTESLTNRVWLEWIRTSKARLVFRYEISDLFFLFYSMLSRSASKLHKYLDIITDRLLSASLLPHTAYIGVVKAAYFVWMS